MPRLVVNYRIEVDAMPEDVFASISDLSRHGEWTDGLNVEAVSDGPVDIGSEYRSVGKQLGKDKDNTLRVVEYEPSTRFCFTATDGKAEFLQEFTVNPRDGGSVLLRRVSFDMNPILFVLFKTLIGPLIANPSTRKNLKAFKAILEGTG